jgi:hypothetical protein
MTQEDFDRLDALERRMAAAWDETALALAEIKDNKLYRRTRDGEGQTWAQYCQRVHQFTPQWANKLIRRAKVLEDIRAESETPVSLSSAAVGHLEGLEPQDRVEIVKAATQGGGKPTAKAIGESKHKKLMGRFQPGGDMHGGTKKATTPARYKLTVVPKDKADLEAFGKLLPSPMTDLKANSVSAWIDPKDIATTLEKVGTCLNSSPPKKVRVVVEL